MSHVYLELLAAQIRLSHFAKKGFSLPKMTAKDLKTLSDLLAD